MKSLVDNEEWKELSKGYWFSNHGRFASQWTKGKNSHIDHNKWEIKITKPKSDNSKGYRGDYIENSIYPFRTDPIAKHITEGRGHQTTVSPNRVRVAVKRHRAVMDCFKPLDKYSHEIGISKEDWDNTPESSKSFIKRQVYVNHKDHDRGNNHIDNLEWIDVRDNAIAKINDRVKNGDPVLHSPHKGKHYSELTRKEKQNLGHLS
jgi:hypothetical protein